MLFSSVQYLKEIKQDTQSKSKLKHWLILFSRLLLFASIILAFANPYFPDKKEINQANRIVNAIYLDNSFSMEAESSGGSVFDLARNQSLELLESVSDNSEWLLLSNDFERKHQQVFKPYQLKNLIQEIKPSEKVRQFHEVLGRFKQLLVEQTEEHEYVNLKVYVFSDFQKTSLDSDLLPQDSSISLIFIPIQAPTPGNLSLDTCWFETLGNLPGEPAELFVKIRNYSSQDFKNIPIRLYLNDTLAALSNFSIKPADTAITSLSFSQPSKDWIHAKIEIEDYPVVFDNQLFFSYEIKNQYRVLGISEEPQDNYLSALFGVEDYFNFTMYGIKRIDYSQLAEFDMIILQQLKFINTGLASELRAYVKGGGKLVFIPALQMDPNVYNSFLTDLGGRAILKKMDMKTQLSLETLEHPYLQKAIKKTERNVKLPEFKEYYLLDPQGVSSEELFFNTMQAPILVRKNVDLGVFYQFSVSLGAAAGDFYTHPILLPIFYQIAFGDNNAAISYGTIGANNKLSFPTFGSVEQLELRAKSIDYSTVPDFSLSGKLVTVYFDNQVKDAGNYEFFSANQILYAHSWNYSRLESDLTTYSIPELKDLIIKNPYLDIDVVDYLKGNSFETYLQEMNRKSLWKYFLWAAILFLITELLLVRYLKIK